MHIYDHPLSIPRSKSLSTFEWIGERFPYHEFQVRGDTYPFTWGADGQLYTSSGDPTWVEVNGRILNVDNVGPLRGPAFDLMFGLDVEKFTGYPPEYNIHKVDHMLAYTGLSGNGPKPTGMISVKGQLYLAIQNLLRSKPPVHGEKCQHGSDAFVITSSDYGQSWTPDYYDIEDRGPMFPGAKFGGPTFINFGRDNENARDEYVYAISGDQWDNGTEMRLGRVHQDRIMETDAWEWVSDYEANGNPNWTGELDNSAAIFGIDRHFSCPEMVYLASLDRYLLLTWHLHQDFSHEYGSDLTILESPEPWGPFELVHYEPLWEDDKVTPYCPRVPLKWFDTVTNTGWLLHSGCWIPNIPHYRAHVRRFRIGA